MEMYKHVTRADSAELAAKKTCRPALTKKWFGGDLEGVTKQGPIRTILLFTIFGIS